MKVQTEMDVKDFIRNLYYNSSKDELGELLNELLKKLDDKWMLLEVLSKLDYSVQAQCKTVLNKLSEVKP